MKKLNLKKDTIRVLTPDLLRAVVGGGVQQGPVLGNGEVLVNGFIMKDSILLRTSTR